MVFGHSLANGSGANWSGHIDLGSGSLGGPGFLKMSYIVLLSLSSK